ncbi:MAG: hypothetical protein C5B50_13225 [Verrucomicrobia bacterium]|nr:MAG: hypothetical protein C5B50_13225 [Verrucomicrobiota bacterium]
MDQQLIAERWTHRDAVCSWGEIGARPLGRFTAKTESRIEFKTGVLLNWLLKRHKCRAPPPPNLQL